ncbi:FAD-dependent monooxygenase [Staphylococcus massiliensis]|uniref:FAD-binding domain-containing protein n=1 Tax=Staphylococcus massiliensis S46 TaxID=1229783 RepID=K9ANV5_9STAP|nr:FAD-dependent monooxygenase [Staphylococcus massiliensis]EKU48979.1 hypothetical protein C273_04210 [Staphylococcus massiliensis S46]MCG3399419.1 FAD-dependent monooxygenase [Staphylococcus massiliensis]MCG3411555.1 FAD-dependent monooxygenase [Staphylococcus massiliensis]PNZ98710.1 hypothetical protein CD133_08055 [Staphylococcus massiliensis CCUG 55927]
MRIAIIGAGIGGLTLASLLTNTTHDVHIFERKGSLTDIGAGIGLGGNVLQKLGNHDLAKGIKNAGHVLNQLEMRNDQNKLLSQVKLDGQTTNVTLLRQDLIDVLATYVKQENIHFNREIKNVHQKEQEVDITDNHGDTLTFDLVIGADGIRSNMRQALGFENKVKYQGYTCFRGVVEDFQLKENHTGVEYWGKTGRVGIVPLLNDKAYWFITINTKENDPKYKTFAKPHLQALFNHYPNEVRQLLDKQGETNILLHDIYDLEPLKTFVKGRVVLLGDAAHATTPNMGQGAGQAMEDAIVLSNCLKDQPHLEDALNRYNKLRVKHTKKVTLKSRKIGKIAQYQNKLMTSMRDTVMAKTPNKLISNQTKFIYKSKES